MPAVPVADGAGPWPVVSDDGAGGAPGQMLTFSAGPARPGADTDRPSHAASATEATAPAAAVRIRVACRTGDFSQRPKRPAAADLARSNPHAGRGPLGAAPADHARSAAASLVTPGG